MAFTGNEDHQIDLADAAALTKNYRDNMDTNGILGEYFSKSYIQKILDQENCVGIRVYYGESTAGAQHLVISGVKANEDDIETGFLAERALKSPPFGGAANLLNS